MQYGSISLVIAAGSSSGLRYQPLHEALEKCDFPEIQ